MTSKVVKCYFSPTQSTKSIVQAVSEGILGKTDSTAADFDLTLPSARGNWAAGIGVMGAEDALVLGFPVYAGRVPKIFLQELKQLKGEGTPAVIIATYGNRAIDDAALEAADVLGEQGFQVAGLVSFPCEHSFTVNVASGRPNSDDIKEAHKLGNQIAEKLGSVPLLQLRCQATGHMSSFPVATFARYTMRTCARNALRAPVCARQAQLTMIRA